MKVYISVNSIDWIVSTRVESTEYRCISLNSQATGGFTHWISKEFLQRMDSFHEKIRPNSRCPGIHRKNRRNSRFCGFSMKKLEILWVFMWKNSRFHENQNFPCIFYAKMWFYDVTPWKSTIPHIRLENTQNSITWYSNEISMHESTALLNLIILTIIFLKIAPKP